MQQIIYAAHMKHDGFAIWVHKTLKAVRIEFHPLINLFQNFKETFLFYSADY